MSRSKSEPPSCCSTTASSTSRSPVASTELKLYQAFIFSVPIFFTFILLFLFYLFYLRRRRVDWASLRMRASLQDHTVDISRQVEMGLKKELREMLPVIVYKESFSVRDTQCPVCLGDYQADDKLQQIPACGHTFHMDCIDHWLTNHITCPLCRLSLLASVKAPSEPPRNQVETVQEYSAAENGEEASVQPRPESCEESHATPLSQSMDEESRTLQNSAGEEQRSECADQGREFRFARNEAEEHENSRDSSAQCHA
ncbi:RING-H2 finger protein ATL7 isoform X3 [Populus nigra]|uniref:RING-H2 finger protein ATL7 isoform X3 n=1 Tax=Populus nigra TaxID=3691 RepID=UPI002B268D67|nr:RING-H2 finger protein ATL7 isoform X3 [Populus nigra]